MVTMIDLSEQISKFWEIEEVPAEPTFSEEDKKCQDHYRNTHKRNEDGTYTVSIPLKENLNELGESRKLAMARFIQLEKRLQKNPKLREEYNNFMMEYLKLGHMKQVKSTTNRPVYYMPHQAVVKEDRSTTKLRVVFDASTKTSTGLSLNEVMYTGPRLQQNLSEILLRWRIHKCVFKADIEKMYRMIRIEENQQDLQRILWRFSETEPIKEYILTTVTYGTASAPYLAVRTLQQLAIDEHSNFPHAVNAALKDFYVDDLMSGADSFDESRTTVLELINLLKSGGFNLRKWSSNNVDILKIIPKELREKDPIEINNGESIKTLGIYWRPTTDTFQFKVNISNEDVQPTKRKILSDIAKLFDPLGWLSPIMITAKIIMQEIWQKGNLWDEEIHTDILQKWQRFRRELTQIESITIPRWIQYSPTNLAIEIHGFCDASEKAYAAAIYSRITTETGAIRTTLLTAKTKVAPIKMKKTLPRLELCGAALLSKLLHEVKGTMNLQHVNTYAWTDSMIALAWIKGGPEKWKSFVANKVSEILNLTKPDIWYHVSSGDNPADVASRGSNPSKLHKLNLWWHGPTWLMESAEKWPHQREKIVNTTEEMKCKQVVCGNTIENNKYGEEILVQYSKLPKLLRVWAYCRRFINACRKIPTPQTKYPTASEILNALTNIIFIIQRNEFKSDIQNISKKQTLDKRSALISLNPFLDPEGLVRLGGRIANSNLPYNEKHPIILPPNHHITKLIIQESHELTLHGSNQATLAFIRRKFWIIKGKRVVKNVLSKCIRCARFKGQHPSQQMGDLPTARVTPSKPFSHTGLDYAGPIKIRTSKGRGISSYKGYISIFVCLATKALHLEVVSGLTTNDFLAAYKRFIARRGRCSDLYSDNATTFVGAQKILDQDLKGAIEANKSVASYMATKGTTWHFIPPAGPHFGGIWEAGVKSVKYHLKRVIGETTLTYEEMSTLLCQIEACLNSRPLCSLTEDPTDINVLTPGHFLVGEALTAPPDPRQYEDHHCLSRWQHIQKMNKDFWRSWTADYLKQLQQRPKWKAKINNVKVGEVVLVKDDGLPPTTWPLARIVNVHPGQDDLVRVVTLQLKDGKTMKRPITKICPLPIEERDHQADIETSVTSPTIEKTKISGHTNIVRLEKEKNNYKGEKPTQDLLATPNPPLLAKENKDKILMELVQRFKAVKTPPKRKRIHPTNIPVRPPLEELIEAKRPKIQESPIMDIKDSKRRKSRSPEKKLTYSKILLTIMVMLFNIMSCFARIHNYTIKYPQSGLYVEQIGEVQMRRGTFRIEVSFTTAEMISDLNNSNKTITQIRKLCDETSKLSKETHCDGLIHHLEEGQRELQKHIVGLQFETANKRSKRGILGKLLEMVFGVNDEVYKNIDELDHNQKLLLQTANHQTNLMLTTIAAANETEVRTIKRLNIFTEKLNKGLMAINEMQRWFSGPDTNKLNIHFLAAYHAASNYIDELKEKYRKLINAYFHRGNLLDFLQPTQILEIITNAKMKLPTNLDILHLHKTTIEMEFSSEEIRILTYLNIAEISKYTLIKCTAIPQKEDTNQYLVLELPTPTLAINYNTQSYFILTEQELQDCIHVNGYSLLCTPTVVRSIENNPNCIIDELYNRQEGNKCPVQKFTVTHIIWKHLHMINTWLFIASKPTTAALQCQGIREDILLNGTGIIKIPQECLLHTRRNTLKSEYSVNMPVIASFIKPIEVVINTSIPISTASAISTDVEPVIKSSEQIFQMLKTQAETLKPDNFWKTIHAHAIGASTSIIALLITAGVCILIRKIWNRKKTSLDEESPIDDHTDNRSEYSLPAVSSAGQRDSSAENQTTISHVRGRSINHYATIQPPARQNVQV